MVKDHDGKAVMHRPYEYRPLDENFLTLCMATVLRSPNDETQLSILWIPDKALNDEWGIEFCCASKAEFSMEKACRGEYKGYHLGGSHKCTTKKRILDDPSKPSTLPFQLEMCFVYVGSMTVEEVALLARLHNNDAHFVHHATNYDKLAIFRNAWLENGAPLPSPWQVKQRAMAAVGFSSVKSNEDSACQSNDWIWQLSHQDTESWGFLEQWIRLWTEGKAHGQTKAASKTLKKAVTNANKEINSAASPARKKKKRRTVVPPVSGQTNRVHEESDKAIVTFIDIPGKTKWDPFTGMTEHPAEEEVLQSMVANDKAAARAFKTSLFKLMVEEKLTLEEAGERAKVYKGMTEAVSDFLRIMDMVNEGWDAAKSQFPALLNDTHFQPIAKEYCMTKSRSVPNRVPNSKKKIPSGMANLCTQCQGIKRLLNEEVTDDLSLEVEGFFKVTRDAPLSAEQITQGMTPESFFKVLCGDADMVSLISTQQIEKRPYRLIYADLPYGPEGDWTEKKFSDMCRNIIELTSEPIVTVIIQMGEDCFSSFLKIARNIFGRAEALHYFKPNAFISGLNRHCGMLEVGLIAHWSRAGAPIQPDQIYHWIPSNDTGRKTCNPNVLEFRKPATLAKAMDATISQYQKPLKMMEYIVYVYGEHAKWGLELCAGSGTAAMLRAGKNVMCVEMDRGTADGLVVRLNNALAENVDAEDPPSEDDDDKDVEAGDGAQ